MKTNNFDISLRGFAHQTIGRAIVLKAAGLSRSHNDIKPTAH